MITLEQAQALKVGDPVEVDTSMMGTGPFTPTTVSFANEDRLHVANDGYQFMLPNCQDGIARLSLPQ